MDNKKHIVAVTAVIKNKSGDRFLMVRRNKNEIAFPGKWALSGGKLESGENIMAVLKREVMEEVGLNIEEWKQFLRDYTFVRPDDHNVVGLCFLVKAVSEKARLSDEFEDFKWIKPEELGSYSYDPIDRMEREVGIAFGG